MNSPLGLQLLSCLMLIKSCFKYKFSKVMNSKLPLDFGSSSSNFILHLLLFNHLMEKKYIHTHQIIVANFTIHITFHYFSDNQSPLLHLISNSLIFFIIIVYLDERYFFVESLSAGGIQAAITNSRERNITQSSQIIYINRLK